MPLITDTAIWLGATIVTPVPIRCGALTRHFPSPHAHIYWESKGSATPDYYHTAPPVFPNPPPFVQPQRTSLSSLHVGVVGGAANYSGKVSLLAKNKNKNKQPKNPRSVTIMLYEMTCYTDYTYATCENS